MKTLESFIGSGQSPNHKRTESLGSRKGTASEAKESEGVNGFVIERVVLSGFMRYTGRNVVTFREKFTVITGQTGSGKTSILDAITFALYKKSSRTDIQAVKTKDICGPGGYAAVSFLQGGSRYQVRRGFTSSGSPYLELKRNGKEIPGTIHELEDVIVDIVGLDYEGFRNSTFVRQEEMKELGSEGGAKRLEIFQKLFRLEIFEKAQENAQKRLNDVIFKKNEMEGEIRGIGKQLFRIPEMEEELKDLEGKMKKEMERLAGLERKKAELTDDLMSLEKSHDEYIKVKAELGELRSRIGSIERKVSGLREGMEKTSRLKEEIRLLEEDTKDFHAVVKEGEELKEKRDKRGGLEKQRKIHKKQLRDVTEELAALERKLSARLEKLEERIRGLDTEIDKDEAFALLRSEGRLQERIERIEKELIWLEGRERILEEIRAEKKDAVEELEVVSEKREKISPDSFVLSELKAQKEGIKKDLAEGREALERRLREAKNALGEVEKEIDELGFGEDSRKRLNRIRDLIIENKRKTKELERKRKEIEKIGDGTRLFEDLISRKREMEEKIGKKKVAVKTLEKSEKRYLDVRKDAERIGNDITDVRKRIHIWQGEEKRLLEEMKKLSSLKKEAEDKRKELLALGKRAEVLSMLKDRIFHRKGIVMYAVNLLLPRLSIETSNNLADMTSGRFGKVKLAPYEQNNRYGIRIEVLASDGKWRDVQEFSGGERTQINAALRFAIAKELAGMPQVGKRFGRMRTLFIDEGDLGSLDTEVSRELFVQKLFDVGRFFEKVVLITHLNDIADRFDGKIEVYMTPEQESRIREDDGRMGSE